MSDTDPIRIAPDGETVQEGPRQGGRATTPEERYCPNCRADLRGDPIPAEARSFHPPTATHYSRLIARADPFKDLAVEWQCPVCGHRWPR